ncbi:MAG: DUF3276 family protein [Treponema sp.]|nr:DUF3276 family protein [Treponema sp.]
MGARGELYTTQVTLDNRSYFFNVKENRNGDIFLQVVESKSRNGEDFDRHAIVVFADDMQKFFKGLDSSISFIEKEQKERSKAAAERKAAKAVAAGKKVYRKPSADEERKRSGVKKTGRVHVVSKRPTENE